MNGNAIGISGNTCPTVVVGIRNIQKCMCDTSRDIIRHFSAVASEDPVYIYINICVCIGVCVCV